MHGPMGHGLDQRLIINSSGCIWFIKAKCDQDLGKTLGSTFTLLKKGGSQKSTLFGL